MPVETLVVEMAHCRVSKIIEGGKLIGISIDGGKGDPVDGPERSPDWSNLVEDIDWSMVTPFRRLVFETLLDNVQRGSLVTYGELASAAGRPGSARAVGSALSSNPWPLGSTMPQGGSKQWSHRALQRRFGDINKEIPAS